MAQYSDLDAPLTGRRRSEAGAVLRQKAAAREGALTLILAQETVTSKLEEGGIMREYVTNVAFFNNRKRDPVVQTRKLPDLVLVESQSPPHTSIGREENEWPSLVATINEFSNEPRHCAMQVRSTTRDLTECLSQYPI